MLTSADVKTTRECRIRVKIYKPEKDMVISIPKNSRFAVSPYRHEDGISYRLDASTYKQPWYDEHSNGYKMKLERSTLRHLWREGVLEIENTRFQYEEHELI